MSGDSQNALCTREVAAQQLDEGCLDVLGEDSSSRGALSGLGREEVVYELCAAVLLCSPLALLCVESVPAETPRDMRGCCSCR